MAAKRNSPTDGTDSIIKLVRRKNRRASITEQFLLPPAKTKQKEKLAQAKHHAFLLRPENASAIHELAERVREITELDATTLGHTLSPMDKHRFQVWSAEFLAILTEFVPSETHENDPILQLLERLQFLQEGRVCLAEFAIDGRQLVEKWERAGVFDDNGESSSDDDDGEEASDDAANIPVIGLHVVDWELEKRRKVEASYVYQCIRERSASRVIKRNTLKWVRSRVAFCSRVEEIQVFGNTTAALMEELTMLSPLQRRAAVSSGSNTNDIFDLMKGKSHVNGAFKINFTDLMHYSKHLALFTVDHALRRVEELQAKRRLYEYRCVIKLQAWWRKMHEVVKGRRMLQLLAEVKRKQEQEQHEQRMREKAAKAPPPIKTDASGANHKVPKTPVSKSSKAASSSSGSASTKAVSKADSEASDAVAKAAKSRATAARESKAAFMPTPPSTPKTNANTKQPAGTKRPSVPHAPKGEDKEDRAARAARAREAREARLRKAFEDELLKQKHEDEEAARDTEDVEEAWKRFLDSAQDVQAEDNDTAGGAGVDMLDLDQSRTSTASSGASGSERGSRGATPYTNGAVDTEEWRSWSDSDDDHAGDAGDHALASGNGNRNGTPQSTGSSRLSTPHAKASSSHLDSDTRAGEKKTIAPIKVVVTVKKGNRSPRRPPGSKNQAPPSSEDGDLPVNETEGRPGLATPATTANASRRQLLLMDAIEARKRRPKAVAGAGQLSRMMPFADFGAIEPPVQPRSQLRSPSQTSPTTRRHLFEMDFHQAAVVDADAGVLDMFFMEQPLVPEAAEAIVQPPPRRLEPEAIVSHTEGPTRVVRAARVAKMRAALEEKPSQQHRQPVLRPEDRRGDSETPRTAPTVFKQTGNTTNNARDRLILRTATSSATDHDDAHAALNPLLKLDFRKEDLMRKPGDRKASTIAQADVPVSDAEALTKSKFGSHAEWLQSMGLGGAAANASRSPGSPRRPNGRQVRLHPEKESREAKLVESMAMVKQSAVQRARKRRAQAHALPLIGRRREETKAAETEEVAVADECEKETLPLVETQTRGAKRRSRTRTAKRSEPMDSHDEEPSPMERVGGTRYTPSLSENTDGESSEGDSRSNGGLDAVSSEDEMEDSSEEDDTRSSEESDESSEEEEGELQEGSVQRRKSSRRPRGSSTSARRSRAKLYEPKHVREAAKSNKPRRWLRSPSTDTGDDHKEEEEEDGQERRGSARRSSSRFRPNVTSLLQRLVPKDKRWSFHAMALGRDQDNDVDEEVDTTLEVEDENESVPREGDEGNSDSEVEDGRQSQDAAKAAAFEKLYTQYLGLLNAGPPLIVRP